MPWQRPRRAHVARPASTKNKHARRTLTDMVTCTLGCQAIAWQPKTALRASTRLQAALQRVLRTPATPHCLHVAADCLFQDLSSETDGAGVIVGTDSMQTTFITNALLDRCSFRNVSSYGGDPKPPRLGGAVFCDQFSNVGLRNCSFADIAGPSIGRRDGGCSVHSNPRTEVYDTSAKKFMPTKGMRSFWMPKLIGALKQTSPWVNTTADDPGFVRIQRSLRRAETREGGGNSAALSAGAIAGIVVACVAACVACIAAAICAACLRRRRHAHKVGASAKLGKPVCCLTVSAP